MHKLSGECVLLTFFTDTSGVVFDTRSKMVMSQGGTAERMKEKVKAQLQCMWLCSAALSAANT